MSAGWMGRGRVEVGAVFGQGMPVTDAGDVCLGGTTESGLIWPEGAFAAEGDAEGG
jgi:hypothetical protein